MREKIIDISDHAESLKKLEKLHFEMNSRSNIIAYMINNNQVSSDAFKQFTEEYTKVFTEYEKAKQKFVIEELGIAGKTSWFINFDTAEITLTYDD